MARKRRFLDRPFGALSRATEAHAALSGHTDNAPGGGDDGNEPGLSSQPRRRRRDQTRDDSTGRFAK